MTATIATSSPQERYYEEHFLPDCDHEDQYQCKCPMCGTTLDEGTHIFGLENTNEDKPSVTVCSDCFYGEEEWLVKEGFFDCDYEPEEDEDEEDEKWGYEYGFIHPYTVN